MALGILSGSIKKDLIETEFRLQIERCLEKGLNILFLNSHEHIHMLPFLYSSTVKLAKEYDIPFVRYSTAEWVDKLNMGSILRNSIFNTLNTINYNNKPDNTPTMIGMSASGNLNLGYFIKRFSSLKLSNIYELMCHPGYFDELEINDKKLLKYHDWENEYNILSSDKFLNLCDKYSIKIIGYRDILDNLRC